MKRTAFVTGGATGIGLSICEHLARAGHSVVVTGMTHYAASKGGVIAFGKTLALEFAKRGVTVNNIAPSVIETPMVAQQRAAGKVPPSENMAAGVPVGRMAPRRHRRRPHVPGLRGGLLFHGPDRERQRRILRRMVTACPAAAAGRRAEELVKGG